jgi:hypothetical protein
MRAYQFTLILADLTEVTDEQANALFEAGCDDGTICSRNGQAHIRFTRESPSLEEAINSATAAITQAGLRAVRVEADCPV